MSTGSIRTDDVVVTDDQVPDPNGLLLSPDDKKLYVISTERARGPAAKATYTSVMLGRTTKRSNEQLFTDFIIDRVKCGPDDALRRRR